MEQQNKDWLIKVFQAAASHFAERALGDDPKLIPISNWEVKYLRMGQEAGLLDINGSFLELDRDKQYSLFGLNREWLVHIAEYLRLIMKDGYDVESVRFEYKQLDIVVFGDQGPQIGIEVKKSEKLGDKLRSDILRLLPEPTIPDNTRGNDAINKIICLFELRPPEFRIVTPTKSWKFGVRYPHEGHLVLTEII